MAADPGLTSSEPYPAPFSLPVGYQRHRPDVEILRSAIRACADGRPWAQLSWTGLIEALLAVGRTDIGLARLVEGHVDAAADPRPGRSGSDCECLVRRLGVTVPPDRRRGHPGRLGLAARRHVALRLRCWSSRPCPRTGLAGRRAPPADRPGRTRPAGRRDCLGDLRDGGQPVAHGPAGRRAWSSRTPRSVRSTSTWTGLVSSRAGSGWPRAGPAAPHGSPTCCWIARPGWPEHVRARMGEIRVQLVGAAAVVRSTARLLDELSPGSTRLHRRRPRSSWQAIATEARAVTANAVTGCWNRLGGSAARPVSPTTRTSAAPTTTSTCTSSSRTATATGRTSAVGTHRDRSPATCLVAIPAHDEADRIEACLRSVAAALRAGQAVGPGPAGQDRGRRAPLSGRDCGHRHGHAARPGLVGSRRAGHGGRRPVGLVRTRLACRARQVEPALPASRLWLFSTDADSVVPADWVSGMLRAAAEDAAGDEVRDAAGDGSGMPPGRGPGCRRGRSGMRPESRPRVRQMWWPAWWIWLAGVEAERPAERTDRSSRRSSCRAEATITPTLPTWPCDGRPSRPSAASPVLPTARRPRCWWLPGTPVHGWPRHGPHASERRDGCPAALRRGWGICSAGWAKRCDPVLTCGLGVARF